LNYGKWNRNL